MLAQAVNGTPTSLLAWPVLLLIGAGIVVLGRSLSGKLRRLPTSFESGEDPGPATSTSTPAGESTSVRQATSPDVTEVMASDPGPVVSQRPTRRHPPRPGRGDPEGGP